MSTIEANTLKPISGSSTLTLGESGDTVSLGTGVTAGTGIGTTINNNADNRVITGSGTANTLEGEANLNFNGTNLMVNTNSTTNTFSGGNDLVVGNTSSGTHGISIQTPNTEIGYLMFADDSTSPNPCFISYDHASNFQRFWVNGAERIRVKSDGKVLIAAENFANNIAAGNGGISLMNTNSGALFFGFGTGTETQMNFGNDNGVIGSIKTSGSGTSFNTSSDYRLKENVDYTFDATTRLKQLKPARFNWIADDTNTLLDGFLAHEVSSIVPEAVTGTKDATETKEKVVVSLKGGILAEGIEQSDWTQGKTDGLYPSNSTWEGSKTIGIYQQIDQVKLVPLLTKALQEAITKIETLEARVQALENA